MSTPDSYGQPWSPPPSEPKPAQPPEAKRTVAKGAGRIQYLSSIRFVFTHPEWLKNVLIGGLIMLIPILSQLVAFGYCYEVTELLHRRPGSTYPLFDFHRFATYIQRGVWPFLISFLVQNILGPLLNVVLQMVMFGTMAAFEADETTGTIVAAIVVPLVLLAVLILIVGLTLVLTPLMLRAGLSQDFGQAFKFGWIKDFIQRMWMETIFVNLFVILISVVFVPLGCVVFCYGGLVMAFFVSLVSAHLNWQLYELYLDRGGEPIPLKPLPADVPPVMMPPGAAM